jgi:hypothetical protein
MIPYTELAAALERWRIRQGLPVSATPIAAAPSVAAVLTPARTAPPQAPPAMRAAPPPPPSAPPSAPPVVAPPIAAAPIAAPPIAAPPIAASPAVPPPPSAQTLDEVDELLEPADEYDNEGNDFSMTFGGPPAAASGSIGGTIGDDVDESTHIGAASTTAEDAFAAVPTTAAPPPPPSAWPEAREWPAEATAATAYGWGSSHRPPGQPGQPGDDDSTIVGGGKKR